MKFQALVNDQAFDLALDGDIVTIDGAPADVSFQRVSANEVLLLLDGRSYPFTAEPQDDGTVRLTHAGRGLNVRVKTERDLLLEEYGVEEGAGAAERELRAPMPGLVLSVLVEPGQEVEVLGYGHRIEIIPVEPMRAVRGFLSGIDTEVDREDEREL